jgi:hypothetical protein
MVYRYLAVAQRLTELVADGGWLPRSDLGLYQAQMHALGQRLAITDHNRSGHR